MGIFSFLKKKEEPVVVAQPTEPKPKRKVHKVETVKGTGMQFCMDNIMSFAKDNYQYEYSKKELLDEDITNERVYEYDFFVKQFTFELEPDNEYDKNAIKILADGKHVAYVKKGSCAHIKKLIASDNILAITGEILGGKYKVLLENEDEKYDLIKDEAPYSVHLEVTQKSFVEE